VKLTVFMAFSRIIGRIMALSGASNGRLTR